MNILMRDSNGQLIAIPIIRDADSCRRMQLENGIKMNKTNSQKEGNKDVYNITASLAANKQLITFEKNSALDEGKSLSNSDSNSHQVIFLESLDLDTSQNIEESTIVESCVFPDNNNVINEPLNLDSNDIENVEEFNIPDSIELYHNKEILRKVNLVVTNNVSSPLCRLCAQQSENMVYIFGLSKEEKDLAEKINGCLPIKVQETDTFPKKICFSCLEKVELVHNFCKTVSEAEASFVKSKESLLNKSAELEEKPFQPETQVIYDCPEMLFSKSVVENSFDITEVKVDEAPVGHNSENVSKLSKETAFVESIQEDINEEIRCRICDMKFCSTRKCYLHAASHSSSNFFPCGLCENISQTMENWRDHFTEHSDGKICERRTANYECQICKKKFVSEGRLKFHLKFHEPGAKPCYCEKCDKFVPSESVLYHHSVMVHLQFREFCCDICGIQFRSQSQLDTHQRKHKNERPYECSICNKRFYSNDSLRRHKKLHLPDKPFQCDQCGKRFDRTNSLTRHLLTHQVEAKQSMICQVCKACNQVFLDVSQSESHVETCNAISDFPQIEEKNLDAMYRCEFCQRCYASIEFAKIHVKSHSGPLPYVCTVCDVTYATYNQVTAHKSAHRKSVQDLHLKEAENTVTKFFFCQFCDKTFLHFTNMNLHRKSCLNSKHWTCRCCAAIFQSRQELTKHKRRRESYENWPCEDCEMTFGNVCGLEIHKEIHTATYANKKVFTCCYCGKDFQQKTHLTIHIRSHTGEKPFPCDLCDKAYSIKADRDNHRRTHTGERPFKCKICVKAFTNPARLREHLLYHSDVRPYKCNYCEQAFKKANARKVHMLIHTGERPFQCEICGNYFRRSGDMNKHKRTQHTMILQVDNFLLSQEA